MLQEGVVLEQQVSYVGVTVLTGVRQTGVPTPGLGVHFRPRLQKVLDQIQVPFLGGLHERRGGTQLDVGAGLDQKVRHLVEATTAGERQCRLLGLLGLGVDVST